MSVAEKKPFKASEKSVRSEPNSADTMHVGFGQKYVSDLLHEFSTKARYWGSQQLDSRDFAQEALEFLRLIVQQETGCTMFEHGISKLRHALYMGRSDIQHLSALRRELKSLAEGGVSRRFFWGSRRRFLNSFAEFLCWYATRKDSLQLLAAESIASAEDGKDLIFSAAVVHDSNWYGVNGFEVNCGLQIIGRAAQPLWFKVFVRHEGDYVRPREEWASWMDSTDCFILSDLTQSDRISSVVPITADGHRIIVDNLRTFFPYTALALQSGAHELQLELGLFDQRGALIAAELLESSIYLEREASPPLSVPSPQSVGMWPRDPVTGDSFDQPIRVVTGVGSVFDREIECVKVQFGLTLVNHVGVPLSCEVRFIEESGELVRSRREDFRDERGAFLAKIELYPTEPFSRFDNIELHVPVCWLDLETGDHELLLEIAILLPDQRPLCGVLRRCVLNMPRISENAPFATPLCGALTNILIGDNGLRLFRFEAGVEGQGKSFAGLCIHTTFDADDWNDQVFRLQLRISRFDGVGQEDQESLVREVWFGAMDKSDPFEVVTRIPFSDLRQAFDLQSGHEEHFRIELFVRQARDLIVMRDERLICISVEEFPEQERTHDNEVISLQDVQILPTFEGRYLCRLKMNSHLTVAQAQRIWIRHELLDERRVVQSECNQVWSLDQDPAAQYNLKGWFQRELAFEVELPAEIIGRGFGLHRVSILNPAQRLVDQFEYTLDSDADVLESAEQPGQVSKPPAEGRVKKGIFGRVRRA